MEPTILVYDCNSVQGNKLHDEPLLNEEFDMYDDDVELNEILLGCKSSLVSSNCVLKFLLKQLSGLNLHILALNSFC